jgi:ubiquinone/menaquinone biosynthesis C-methylase UbiE
VSEGRYFDHVAALYERARPEYPPDAVAWLVEQLSIGEGSTVLDLGAGTGKLTRALTPYARRVIAVDPGPRMLDELRRAVPDAEVVVGEAEAIPLADDSVDAVVCGQSFHWFRQEEALPEIRRVLRGRGGLGLIWNLRDPDDELQQVVSELIAPFVPSGRPPSPTSVAGLIEETSFGEVTEAVFRFEQELDADAVTARVASISFIAAADEERKRGLEHALRELVAGRGEIVRFRYRTEAYVTFSVG